MALIRMNFIEYLTSATETRRPREKLKQEKNQ